MHSTTAGLASTSIQRSLCLARWGWLCLALAFGTAQAQTAVPETVVVDGANQTVNTGSVLPQRFVIRITDAQGQPLAGVRVGYSINYCFQGVPPPGGGCPPVALYGRFDTADGSSEVLSDANGLATSAAFVAGSVPGQYEIYSFMPQQQVGSLQIPFNTQFRLFPVTQVLGGGAPSASAIPTTSTWSLIAMVSLLLCAALVRLKGARPERDAAA